MAPTDPTDGPGPSPYAGQAHGQTYLDLLLAARLQAAADLTYALSGRAAANPNQPCVADVAALAGAAAVYAKVIKDLDTLVGRVLDRPNGSRWAGGVGPYVGPEAPSQMRWPLPSDPPTAPPDAT